MCAQQKKPDLAPLEPILAQYNYSAGNLIGILQKTQDVYGYLPIEAIYHIALKTNQSPASVMGVATFYAQFRLEPVGKHLILLCQGTACHVNGAAGVMAALCTELDIEDGGTTEDGLFTLKSVACLGCCSLSPVMMIGETTYGSLTPQSAADIIRKIREEETRQ